MTTEIQKIDKGEITLKDVRDKIITVQNKNVILDCDVAWLYGVDTNDVNQSVKRNPDKFPEGYIIALTDSEKKEVATICGNPKINILRKRHREPKNAMVETENYSSLRKDVINGSSQILRPIIMTTTVAILVLLPASLSTNIGSDVQRPLATVIVYGLLAGTIITLYLLPTIYYLMEKREIKRKM